MNSCVQVRCPAAAAAEGQAPWRLSLDCARLWHAAGTAVRRCGTPRRHSAQVVTELRPEAGEHPRAPALPRPPAQAPSCGSACIGAPLLPTRPLWRLTRQQSCRQMSTPPLVSEEGGGGGRQAGARCAPPPRRQWREIAREQLSACGASASRTRWLRWAGRGEGGQCAQAASSVARPQGLPHPTPAGSAAGAATALWAVRAHPPSCSSAGGDTPHPRPSRCAAQPRLRRVHEALQPIMITASARRARPGVSSGAVYRAPAARARRAHLVRLWSATEPCVRRSALCSRCSVHFLGGVRRRVRSRPLRKGMPGWRGQM